MYNACDGGNYCRAGATASGAGQIGPACDVTLNGAIVVRPDCAVYTSQQLAAALSEWGGPFLPARTTSHCILLEGFLPRDQINVLPRAQWAHANRFNLNDEG